MKPLWICCCLAAIWSFDGNAQSDSVTLSTLAKTRALLFATQQRQATIYAGTHNKSTFFKDDNGNPIYLVGITPSGMPLYWSTLNADAAITTGVAPLRSGGTSGLNLQGEGMRVGVWDGGRVKDHIELGQRVIAKEGATLDNHATHVTGTLIATGINPAAKGMAPLAQASTHDFLNDEAEMAILAGATTSPLLFSNHSYGTVTGWFRRNGSWEWSGDPSVNATEDYRFGFYDTRAQSIDQIASLAPFYTIVWAAGNDRAETGDGSKPADCNGGSGYDCIIPEAVSKNVITVGAVNSVLAYANPFDITMSFFSSWGPTDDGRIKPDLVGDGVNLFSLSSNGTDTYATMSGTSMATPNVTGSLMLLQELYGSLHAGDPMKSATLKALAIHSAKEAGNFPGPDYSFGWGLVDATAAAKTLEDQDDQSVIISEATLKNDSVFKLVLHPQANRKITATIVWTDPPGSPAPRSVDPVKPMLVNDLDLRIVDELGAEQLPWTLDPANPSQQATRADNFRDNVEKIEFDLPQGKEYTLTVRHKGSLRGGKQDFSIIVTYVPVHTGTTFYWVGDSGSWTDGSHWSASSGGLPGVTIPGESDRVVVDENSFDGIGTDIISIANDVACAELIWLNSKPSGISLNDHALSIASRWITPDEDFVIQTPGIVHLIKGLVPGNFVAHNNKFTGATLVVDGESWSMKGNFSADELELHSGTLKIGESDLLLNRLSAPGGTALPRELQLHNTTITLNQSSAVDGNGLKILAFHSALIMGQSPVTLQWQSVEFPGEIRIGSGSEVTIEGDNRIAKVSVEGTVMVNGSNRIDTLALEAGAEMELTPASVQTLMSSTQIQGTSTQPVTIHSPGPAALYFSEHDKLCFDFLTISDVAATGKAVVNAGINSTLSNASGWQQKICEEVLFADFEVKYNCAGSLTEFTNKSSGDIATYTWRFGESQTSIHDINPVWKFGVSGKQKVFLAVTSDNRLDSITKEIEIIANPLPGNRIISNKGIFTSFVVGSRYQWYSSGLAIPGATSRLYNWGGAEGVYQVVAYEGQCNSPSDTIVVTGLGPESDDIDVYPNPSSSEILLRVPGAPNAEVRVTNLLGILFSEQIIDHSETRIPVQSLPQGVYIIHIRSGTQTFHRKVVVAH